MSPPSDREANTAAWLLRLKVSVVVTLISAFSAASAAAAPQPIQLTVTADTAKAITLTWWPPTGQEGYIATIDGSEILTDGKRHIGGSQTRNWVSIGKPQDGLPHSYGVVILGGDYTGAVTSPAPADQIAFTGDFETGDTSQWTGGVQCANYGTQTDSTVTRGDLYLDTATMGQGRYSGRFELPAAATKTACEVLSRHNIGLGSDDYYGLMVYLPVGWQEPSSAGWGLMVAQLGFQGIWGPPIGIEAHADEIDLVAQTGLCRTDGTGCAYSSGPGGNVHLMVAVPAPLPLGVWHELVIHIHHATDLTGVVEVWHRLKGQTAWTQTVSWSGYPTVQWTADGFSTLKFNDVVDKIGAYRGDATFPLTVWEDGFVRGSTFAAVAARLP
jgi:Polysaccharide lyase